MILSDFLGQIDQIQTLSSKSLILFITYYLRKHGGTLEFTISDIRSGFQGAFLKTPSNLRALVLLLSKGKNSPLLKINAKPTFALSVFGLKEVESYLTSSTQSPTSLEDYLKSATPLLAKMVSKVNKENKRRFLSEAIDCLGIRAKRATIIMTWCAAMDHMHDYVLAHKIVEFNAALSRRSDKYSKLRISCKDDFAEIKESAFIENCRSAGIISSDIRKILNEKLDTRNTFAHPSDIEIHDSKVVNFIEDLVDNVIVKYKI